MSTNIKLLCLILLLSGVSAFLLFTIVSNQKVEINKVAEAEKSNEAIPEVKSYEESNPVKKPEIIDYEKQMKEKYENAVADRPDSKTPYNTAPTKPTLISEAFDASPFQESLSKYFDYKAFMPAEITQLTEEDIFSINCTYPFRASQLIENILTYVATDRSASAGFIYLLDKQILDFINQRTQKIKNDPLYHVQQIITCNSSNGDKIYLAQESVPELMSGGTAVAILTNLKDEIVIEGTTPTNNPYRSCTRIIAYTKANILYKLCTAGDGGAVEAWIEKVDFAKRTSSIIRRCFDVYVEPNKREWCEI